MGPQDLFDAGEFQVYETRLSELQRKTLDRLRLTDGKIERLTFFGRAVYPATRNSCSKSVVRERATTDESSMIRLEPNLILSEVTPRGPSEPRGRR